MILDTLDNCAFYGRLSPLLSRAFEFLRGTNLEALEPGRHEIKGTHLYALVNEYMTKPLGEGRWEAHRKYIDLQCMARGEERIGYGHLARFSEGRYDEEKDFLPLEGEGEFATLRAGYFMLLFPWDAHMPGMAAGAPVQVKKAVVKILSMQH